ncbi:encapsulin, partial [Escherichia coli]
MNNLHRELAPISDAAWSQIEDEATRTLKRHLAARRVVDVRGPSGFDLAAIGTGHTLRLENGPESAGAWVRETRPMVELVVPFE